MATRPVRVQRREGRRITRYEEPEFEQTRYDLRESTGGAGRRHYDEQGRGGGGRYYAKRMPSPMRVGRRRARSPSPDVYRETARRRREYPATGKRPAAVASAAPPAEEEYEAHPLDEFDRYMLAKRRRRGRAREHMRPAAREMERIAYPTGPVGLRRRRHREEEEEPESEHYPSEGEEENEEYERFREQRQRRLAGYGEERRGRQMTRRRDLVAGRRGREEEEEEGEGEEGEEGHEYYSPEELEEEEGEGYTEEEEGEGLMSAPEELDEDEEFITGRRMPIRRRGADYGRGGGETTQRFKLRRRGPEEEEERRTGGRGRKRGREEEHEEEHEEEPQGRRARKLPARKTHRHPTYEDMIAEALVKVGKNGKASGVAIFKYIHDHFDMPANDRLVRNHLHQAFERLMDDGKLRHKKASYVLPRNLLTEYGTKYGAAKEEAQQKAEKKEGEDQQGAQKEGVQEGGEKGQEKGQTTEEAQEKTAAGGEQPSEEKGAAEQQAGEGTTASKKGAGGRKKSR
ncbi:linker histone H1 and H5 domain containing protein [Acanthamoeba castellanii str. Neff]|uniref:Linker histone H1 and H5 domain containing protein n=1 Tax=Acanthamoeba castellanii (strain ATCC 30010 / Neff) TaxID=1257118 RepID=L8GIT8_ACACF|nr:linker histone H1 and H5 domain containing protein [Acanthamoeba castellanii str. Neff]ELR12653.1 linker histone H1 and H5 domain containing protein [Acanthamoeba castellanii str. Neff]